MPDSDWMKIQKPMFYNTVNIGKACFIVFISLSRWNLKFKLADRVLPPFPWWNPHSSSGKYRKIINPLRPNSDLSQTSHCNIKGLSVSELMRIENMITQVKFY